MKIKKRLVVSIIGAVLLLASMLFAGKRTNPPVERQITWNATDTKDLFYRACADCHSNDTDWPWYTNFAPVSWRVIGHVNEGREHFNISASQMGDADEAAEEVRDGEMPLRDYKWFHPEARFSAEETARLIAGLEATFGSEASGDPDAENGTGDDDSDDD